MADDPEYFDEEQEIARVCAVQMEFASVKFAERAARMGTSARAAAGLMEMMSQQAAVVASQMRVFIRVLEEQVEEDVTKRAVKSARQANKSMANSSTGDEPKR